jgi:serine/threonine protein phosphatase 1
VGLFGHRMTFGAGSQAVSRGSKVFWRRILGRSDRPNPRFRTAPGVRIYAIGDIHGRADLLASTLAAVGEDILHHPDRRCVTVLVGDYIDRGPDSQRVVSTLIEWKRSRETVCLMGNHEMMLLRFLEDPETWDFWVRSGGTATLLSYGVRPQPRPSAEQKSELAQALTSALPERHREFLATLPFSYQNGDILFVHAGLRPGAPLEQQKPEDLIWIREEFLNSEADFGAFVVHGHTPVEMPDLRSNRANIDTGAYATGKLTCLVLQDEKLTVL